MHSREYFGRALRHTRFFRLHVRDAQGNLTQSVVCKLGELSSVLDEATRYDKFANRLPPAATPRKVRVQRWGAAGDAGVFYQLASGYDENVFSILHDGSRIVETINELKRMMDPWARGQERRHFSDIRRIEISDADFAYVRGELNFDWIGSLENQMVQTSWSCTHGDLHGANILVDQKSMPILIDFGDMSDGPATRDPITLELSALFHVDGPMKGSGWPGDSASSVFLDINTYLKNCPSPEFVKACRTWADARSVSKREILAVAYAYLVRQPKYPDTDKDLIRGLLQGVRVAFERT
ncbi:phosphotransferase [Paraburkholderia sp. 1N]|uniref:Phosphotransferase n=1 Tax=Paraburkholderia solitsugae TaxID=2675748 RepID=A0ABX2C1H4_9BURK|nr:phosphotransferase [Paraburkholderia solitsugae]NPT46848.1 phosphotransferase [Paraburkholderia solitsugae]NPT46864.1 phosphotransferase [Paraburkholderia solitsugae]